MPSLGTLLPVTYTFLNLMGSLVCYSFSIARIGQSSDEWFIRNVAQGSDFIDGCSTSIRKSKGLLAGREGRMDHQRIFPPGPPDSETLKNLMQLYSPSSCKP
jgi:hypothetical protein